MCYCCQVCDRVHSAKGPALLIRIYRELEVPKFRLAMVDRFVPGFGYRKEQLRVHDGTATRKEIAKELKVCSLCFEGYGKGVPLENLARMNRPQEPVLRVTDAKLMSVDQDGRPVFRVLGHEVLRPAPASAFSPQKAASGPTVAAISRGPLAMTPILPPKKRKTTDELIQNLEAEGGDSRQTLRKHPPSAKRGKQQDGKGRQPPPQAVPRQQILQGSAHNDPLPG